MTEERERPSRALAEQIFVVAGAMVGVCVTLLGIVGIIDSLSPVALLTEELLAANGIVFLFACLSSYMSLRTKQAERARLYERAADIAFIFAMVALVAIGVVFALQIG